MKPVKEKLQELVFFAHKRIRRNTEPIIIQSTNVDVVKYIIPSNIVEVTVKVKNKLTASF